MGAYRDVDYTPLILCGDASCFCEKIMKNNLVDLIITSPPYNVNLGNNKYKKNGYDVYNDNLIFEKYILWLTHVFFILYDKLKDGGRCAINIGDGKNGALPTHALLTERLVDMGYLPMSTIIWDKNTTSNRAAWGSYKSPSSPSFPSRFEYILIFAKKSRKLLSRGTTDLTKEEFVEYTNSIWNIAPSKDTRHPSPFPVAIPLRLIKMLSWEDATVLDPFCGIGTTLIAAKALRRHSVGIDISPQYAAIAGKDLQTEVIVL